jgi:dTDP-4-amino-4,6-dideoxygalactose transaminase
MGIPQSNPKAAYIAQKFTMDQAVARVLDSGWYILGKEVENFEQEFAAVIQSSDAVSTASGTDALELALRVCGIGEGDWVVTVSHTAVATAAAIRRAGARPLFVDIDPLRYTLAPAALRQLLETPGIPHPKAVIPVHLYGQPAEMPAILEIARQYDLRVIEDCAQAHGASLNHRALGVWGDFGCFSFYPTKNLGALGDGGAVVGSDLGAMKKLRLMREYGWAERNISHFDGVNSRLDELQAAILRVKLPHLSADNARRQAIAARYDAGLANTGLTLPTKFADTTHVYHQYVIQTWHRDTLRKALAECGVGTGIHYPAAVHRQPAFADPDFTPLPLPHTQDIVPRILSLPMFPELTDVEVDTVIDAILRIRL